MITGKNGQTASQHLKGVSSFSGNAKLISANDTSNYTYRGRFLNDAEALSIGYLSSQKAHNALKWLLANQGIQIGERRLICWNPSGIEIPKVSSPLSEFFKGSNLDSKADPTNYVKQLRNVVWGYKSKLPESESVIIASFEAATSGRLSVTYYNELNGSDFLDRLYYWDTTCCWNSYVWGNSAPSLYQIVNCAFGTQRLQSYWTADPASGILQIKQSFIPDGYHEGTDAKGIQSSDLLIKQPGEDACDSMCRNQEIQI